MRAVNLASKPFVNRRPVIRVAAIVWVLGLGLLAVNIWRYGDFFRTVSGHRSRLADLEQEIGIAEEQNAGLRRRIDGLQLDEDNSTARYLNGLIHQRNFPWSQLFDDIEEVLPKDVYLTGLSPAIEKLEKTKRRTAARSPGSPGSPSSRARSAGKPVQPKKAPKKVAEEQEKDIDRVLLAIQGYSRSDEAMLEMVDSLYASPTFLDPELISEKRDPRTGLVIFGIRVTYLTRARLASAPPGGLLADAGTGDPSGLPGAAGLPGSAPEAYGAAGTLPGAPDGVYGQPGFAPPGGPPAGGQGLAPRPARPGFGPADGSGQASQDPRFPAGGSRGAGAAPAPDRFSQPGVIQPGFGPSGAPATGGSGVVVPPRRPPGGLQPVPSATPRLRAGGGR